MTLAERLRSIAADPTPAALAELLRLVSQVASIERLVDDIVAEAMADAVIDAHALTRERARRDGRRHLRVVRND